MIMIFTPQLHKPEKSPLLLLFLPLSVTRNYRHEEKLVPFFYFLFSFWSFLVKILLFFF